LRLEALAIYRRVLGPTHPRTLALAAIVAGQAGS
jgi:hypothetical protein